MSAYLQRLLRTLAEQDNHAARHIISMSSAEYGRGDSEGITKFPNFQSRSRDAGEHRKGRLER